MIAASNLLKRLINGPLEHAGLRLVRNDPPTAHTQADLGLRQILSRLGITVVFDVGASFGQFAERLRSIGYSNRIVSFEPQSAAFSVLREKASADAQWEVVSLALGDQEADQELNLSRNSWSSSFLRTMPHILEIEPTIEKTNMEKVSVKPLDDIYQSFINRTDSAFLKLDVQGYEPNVLAGASEFLLTCRAVQMEMALIPSYRHQRLFPEMLELMIQQKFHLVHLERGFWDSSSGFLLEADGIFVREYDIDAYLATAVRA